MALFNPAVALASIENNPPLDKDRLSRLHDRMGVEPQKLSPCHHVEAGAPPAIVFHGKADTTVPYWTAEAFAKAMKDAGNRCELHGYEGQPHGFFNYGRSKNEYYLRTVRALDQFLSSLGYVDGEPTIEGPVR